MCAKISLQEIDNALPLDYLNTHRKMLSYSETIGDLKLFFFLLNQQSFSNFTVKI